MIFVTGGVRSGKSAFAEKRAQQEGPLRNYYYIATGAAFDDEMAARIQRHQLDRKRQPIAWQTVEVAVHIPEVLGGLSKKDVVLFECGTTWLSNVLYESEAAEQRTAFIDEAVAALKMVLTNWRRQGATVIIVSNEVLDEQLSRYADVNLYRRYLGQLHQWFVHQSEEAYEIQFQLVQRWK